jgi:hypothetical protein
MTVGIILPKERRKVDPKAKLLTENVFRNLEAIKMLNGIHEKYGKHAWLKNKIVLDLCIDNYGSLDVMERPVCEHCEKPAMWHVGGVGYCWACGGTTPKPITVKQYLMNEFGKLNQQQLEALDMLSVFDDEGEEKEGEQVEVSA